MERLELFSDEINNCSTIAQLGEKLTTEVNFLVRLPETESKANLSSAVERAKEYILVQYHNPISVNDIAESVGLSDSGLMSKFKKETGQTVNQYLVQVRINKAKKLLRFKSVTETAFEVGFNNSNYFGTVFKKQTGQTPGQFQQSENMNKMIFRLLFHFV